MCSDQKKSPVFSFLMTQSAGDNELDQKRIAFGFMPAFFAACRWPLDACRLRIS
ncbi:MAG: hypothetical protein VCC04_00465 [Myxococcota bacterium]